MNYLKQHQFVIRFIYQHLSRKQFLILSGILVGLTAGIAAILLKVTVYQVHLLAQFQLNFFNYPYLNLFLPLIGILITVYIVRTFLKGKDGRGVGNVLQDISQRSGVIPKYKMYAQLITSAITVGFGGSSGLEGPIAVTGSAIGSNFARTYRLSYRERILLVGCGAAAGIAAVFNAPITGLMFAIEVILVGVVFSDFIPLIIASVSGALLAKIILNDDILIDFRNLQEFDYQNVPYYLLLGVFSGLVSVYYARIARKTDYFFHHQIKWNPYYKALLGGLTIALLCFLFPPLFGEGYESVKSLASGQAQNILRGSFFNIAGDNQWTLLLFVGLIFLTKVFATSITLASGGSGGNFAPSLFTGAFMGFFFSTLINQLSFIKLPVNNFTLVGMCGILSGVMYAPLTGIFLIAEITGGYELIIPLMMVSTVSYTIAKFFEPYSMDVKDLIPDRKIFTENYDQNILSLIKIYEIIDTHYEIVYENDNLTKLLAIWQNTNKEMVVCKDVNGKYQGYILFENVKKYVFNLHVHQTINAKNLLTKIEVKVIYSDQITTIIDKFEKFNMQHLPVFEDNEFVGFISKTDLLTAYRDKLKLTLS